MLTYEKPNKFRKGDPVIIRHVDTCGLNGRDRAPDTEDIGKIGLVLGETNQSIGIEGDDHALNADELKVYEVAFYDNSDDPIIFQCSNEEIDHFRGVTIEELNEAGTEFMVVPADVLYTLVMTIRHSKDWADDNCQQAIINTVMKTQRFLDKARDYCKL